MAIFGGGVNLQAPFGRLIDQGLLPQRDTANTISAPVGGGFGGGFANIQLPQNPDISQILQQPGITPQPLDQPQSGLPQGGLSGIDVDNLIQVLRSNPQLMQMLINGLL